MNWTAQIVWLDDTGNVAVVLSDGTQKAQQKYVTDGTMASLRPQVLRTIADLSAQQVKRDLAVGQSVDTTPIVPPDPPKPTPEQIDLATFLDLVRQMRAVSFGLTTKIDLDAVTQQAQALLDANPTFVTLMGSL